MPNSGAWIKLDVAERRSPSTPVLSPSLLHSPQIWLSESGELSAGLRILGEHSSKWLRRRCRPVGTLQTMKLARFEYDQADSADEAVALPSQFGKEARTWLAVRASFLR